MTNVTLLAIAGGVILLAVASYAGYLLMQLRQQKNLQKQQIALAVDKRNANIFDSVNTLCLAGIQGQCDLSEVSIRVYNILDYVQGDARIDLDKDYPALSELYHLVKEMARGEKRQALAKRERMQQNLERHKAETRLTDAVVAELKQLQQAVKPLNNQISIQMVS